MFARAGWISSSTGWNRVKTLMAISMARTSMFGHVDTNVDAARLVARATLTVG